MSIFFYHHFFLFFIVQWEMKILVRVIPLLPHHQFYSHRFDDGFLFSCERSTALLAISEACRGPFGISLNHRAREASFEAFEITFE